jgi:AbiV family abortive infection protein
MEECGKIDMIGAAATGLTLGRPVDLQALEKDFRDHKAKNFANAYLSEPSETEKSAREANDRQAASEAFEHSQREIHGFLNTAKNASMYVDFKQGRFISPDEVVGEEEATIIAALSNYFMTLTYPRLKSLRRMLEEPQHHAEFMSAVGDVLVDSLANEVSIMGMEESLRNRITETAKRLIAKSRTNRGFSSGGQ